MTYLQIELIDDLLMRIFQNIAEKPIIHIHTIQKLVGFHNGMLDGLAELRLGISKESIKLAFENTVADNQKISARVFCLRKNARDNRKFYLANTSNLAQKFVMGSD